MEKLRKILRSLISSVKFWKGREEVPGVADKIRRTQLKQDQKARQADMQELLKLVREGRLHEADERQLEALKLALELNNLIGERPTTPVAVAPAADELVNAIKQAISEGMSNITVNAVSGNPADDPSRPQMRHVSLADLIQDDTRIDISHSEGIGHKVEGAEESSDKLEKLRKLKGGK